MCGLLALTNRIFLILLFYCVNILCILGILIRRWWSKETIAVVTGGNRGIGFEISRQLADHGVTVVLTSRDASVGVESTKVLQEGGLDVDCHQLDIIDSSSVNEFAEWLKEKYGGLDILVRDKNPNSREEYSDIMICL